MNIGTLPHGRESTQSIQRIWENTSVSILMKNFYGEDLLREYVDSYFWANYDSLVKRSYYYQEFFGSNRWTILKLIEFLESFNELKTCGILHERNPYLNRKNINPLSCKTKEWNPCCAHMEENGLLYGIVAWLVILSNMRLETPGVRSVGMLFWKLQYLDSDVSRKDSGQKVTVFRKWDLQPQDTIRQYAISKQKIIWTQLMEIIHSLVRWLKSLIDSKAILALSSGQQRSSLPQVELSRIL